VFKVGDGKVRRFGRTVGYRMCLWNSFIVICISCLGILSVLSVTAMRRALGLWILKDVYHHKIMKVGWVSYRC
jgi:hypothetical protein